MGLILPFHMTIAWNGAAKRLLWVGGGLPRAQSQSNKALNRADLTAFLIVTARYNHVFS